MGTRAGSVGAGAGWAVAVALPAVLVAQIADAAGSGDGTSPLVYPCALVALAGMALGGWMAGRDRHAGATTTGALAGLAAIAALQLLGLARELAGGHPVAWATIPVVLAVGAGLGAGGATLADRRPGRTRP